MRRPNIILILADQHRWDCLGYAGNPDVRTPNLDALAKHGVVFSQAICQWPMGVPSRCTLMTGQYAGNHRVFDNHHGLGPGTATLPRLLRGAGYYTAAVGQMRFTPLYGDYGFEVMDLAERSGFGRHEDDYHKWLDDRHAVDQIDHWDQVNRDAAPQEYWDSFGAMPSTLPEEYSSTTWIGNQVVRLIQSTREPFFLWVGFIKPHHPFDPPSPWDRMYGPAALALPGGFRVPVSERDRPRDGVFDLSKLTEPAFRRALSYYYANISHMDNQVGRILATVGSRGHTNNIVVFAACHGCYMGQHGLLLGGDAPPYDALIRVPLVIAGLAGQRSGETEGALAELTDLMPTLLEAAGVPVPDTVQGKSLVPLLRGRRDELRAAAFCEYLHGTRIVRSHEHKLVDSRREDFNAFYDLVGDPHEFENLLGRPHSVKEQVMYTKLLRRRR